MDRVAAIGAWGRVEWALTRSGAVVPACMEYRRLDEGTQAKVLALFRRLAETGRIDNREKFRQLGKMSKGRAGQGLWEFKSYQDRFIGDFRPGGRFVISAYTRKKKPRLDREDVERAVDALSNNDYWEEKVSRR